LRKRITDIKKKMNEIMFGVENSDEGGFVAKALGFSIFTEGETYQELKENIIDAVKCHLSPQEFFY
jgi:predicted RNase H-like HicB family nuclease